MRIIPLAINDKNIIIQKADRYIKEDEIKLAIEDIVKDNQLELSLEKKIDLSNICDSMFSIMYKGVATIIEKINDKELYINKIVFEVC